jgi:hypothetical protein
MKALLIAATATAVALAAAPAFAQDPYSVSDYGTLGYSNWSGTGDGKPDADAIQGRLGARFGRYLGVEGEVSSAVNSDHIGIGGAPGEVRVNSQYAGYGVGYLPVLPNADIFARVGYGATNFHTTGATGAYHGQDNSLNYGVGGQYFMTAADGVRVDYTRSDFARGPDGNTWGVSYVRKF